MDTQSLGDRLRTDADLLRRCIEDPATVLAELALDVGSLAAAGVDLAGSGPELDRARAALFALLAAARP